MLNRIVLIGRLTRDPELRYTQNGVAVASFTLAVDRSFKSADGQRETDFINIVAWRGLGENCSNYLSKGKLAAVDGRLQIRSYEGKDGVKRQAAEVVADDVRFLSPRDDNFKTNTQKTEDELPWDGVQGDVDDIPDGQSDLPF
jgi:single-strand DNA-binding protein